MAYRYLGNSGLKISEITYGNWLTHGSQVENDIATQCVRAALDAGITTFDTADVYANGAAETVLGDALKGERRESLEIFTKVYFPVGPKGPNDTGLSRFPFSCLHHTCRLISSSCKSNPIEFEIANLVKCPVLRWRTYSDE
jgi:aryl-alcohol dehydrogenase-like predicted oxidoreductase